ncbi:MAG: quinone-dependent dihydroorotate dehydrogenase [Betaproteobacteria bacterium]
MIYSILRQFLFSLNPETAHAVGMNGMVLANKLGALPLLAKPMIVKPVEVMGLQFPNTVGLAAGLDKNGEYIDTLAALGFGFIEIGTVTPRPQPGNPKPRMFRLPQAEAIINRMGFNNAGVDRLLENVRASKFAASGGILGINIGKNATTPIEQAADDYLLCLDKVYAKSSYVAVNISSPNTKNLRELQKDDALDDLLARLKSRQEQLADQHGKYVPMVLKIAPDLEDAQITAIADALRRHGMDGVIASNTTLSRVGVEGLRHGDEAGGLSGAPVREKSTAVLKKLALALQGEIPIIGVGGIMRSEDAMEKIRAGASLVQLYTGFIYGGPDLIWQAASLLAKTR